MLSLNNGCRKGFSTLPCAFDCEFPKVPEIQAATHTRMRIILRINFLSQSPSCYRNSSTATDLGGRINEIESPSMRYAVNRVGFTRSGFSNVFMLFIDGAVNT